ncbi:MAG: hypothetical protein U1D55_07690 [Phycisphaerae bacterium]
MTLLAWLSARGGLLSALTAHALFGFVALVLFGMAVIFARFPHTSHHLAFGTMPVWDFPRLALAYALQAAMDWSAGRGDVWAVLAAIAAIHASFWGVAWVVTPWVLTAEPVRRRYLRAVRLTLWSTVIGVLIGFVAATTAALDQAVDWNFPGVTRLEGGVCVALAGLLVWGRVLSVGAASLAALTPQFEPPQSRCRKCGYLLTGLSPAARCPECGEPVAPSLPDARRPTRWALRGGFGQYFATLWCAMTRRDFFATLATHDSHAANGISTLRPRRSSEKAAATFAWWTCLLCGVIFALSGVYFDVAPGPRVLPLAESLPHILIGLALPAAAAATVSRLLLLVMVLRASALAGRDPRNSTPACCYATAFFVPTVLCLVGALRVEIALEHCVAGLTHKSMHLPLVGWFGLDALTSLALSIPVFAMCVWGLVRIRQALIDVRYA